MKYLFLAILIIFACKKNENTDPPQAIDQNKSDFETTLPNKIGDKKSIPYPDTTTFFPLIPGSYWIFYDRSEGETEMLPLTRKKDSVTSISLSDSGYIAEVLIQKEQDSSIHKARYRVDLDGMVWMEDPINSGYELHTALNPTPNQKIGPFTVHMDDKANSFTLENFDPESDSLDEEQRENWNGKFYKRGIGLESHAGIYSSTDLVEYRIGFEGNVVNLRK